MTSETIFNFTFIQPKAQYGMKREIEINNLENTVAILLDRQGNLN